MSNEELHLPPNNNPFKVPDGYFDNLTERIMQQIPEETATRKAVRVPLWRRYDFRAAAAVALVVLGVGAYSLFHQKDTLMSEQQATAVAEMNGGVQSAEPIDQVADYIMCDNHDLYAYISGE